MIKTTWYCDLCDGQIAAPEGKKEIMITWAGDFHEAQTLDFCTDCLNTILAAAKRQRVRSFNPNDPLK